MKRCGHRRAGSETSREETEGETQKEPEIYVDDFRERKTCKLQ